MKRVTCEALVGSGDAHVGGHLDEDVVGGVDVNLGSHRKPRLIRGEQGSASLEAVETSSYGAHVHLSPCDMDGARVTVLPWKTSVVAWGVDDPFRSAPQSGSRSTQTGEDGTAAGS